MFGMKLELKSTWKKYNESVIRICPSKEKPLSRSLESFWADILSKNPKKIRKAINLLSEDEREVVIKHLRKMSSETGWSEGQKHGARTALEILQE